MKRFWAKVNKRGPKQPHMRTRCWVWIASVDGRGYGRFSLNRKNTLAHRVAFKLSGEEFTDDQLILHHCDVARCVRPSHLHTGTYADNTREMIERGRAAPAHGEWNPNAQLSANDVLQIRKRVADGTMCKQLAVEYAVTPTTISQIVLRRTWSHL